MTTEQPEAEETDTPAVEPIPILTKVPKSNKPKYFVAGDAFFAQSEEGEFRLPLRFATKHVRKIMSAGGEEIDQLFDLLAALGDAEALERLDELDILDTTEIAIRFFQAWQEKNEARLGELRRSSLS